MELPMTATIDLTEYSIPLSINDIINICKDFNMLGWQAQGQIESIIENGIEECIASGSLKIESLPLIKYFLNRVCDNYYFGDASLQAAECLSLIQEYENKYNIQYISKDN